MRLTLRARVVLAISAVVLLVVAAATVAHVVHVAWITLRASADEGTLLARQLFAQSSRAVAVSQSPSPAGLRYDPGIRALLESMVGYSRTAVYAAIVDPEGRVVAHSNPALQGTILPSRPSLEAVLGRGTVPLLTGLLRGPELYETALVMRLGDRQFGTVRVGVSTSLVRRGLIHGLLSGAALAAVALVVAVAVGLGAGSVLLRSLRRIARGMDQLAQGEWGATVNLTRDDELGELAARVNRLGERIQSDRSQWQSERAQMEGILNTLEDAVLFLDADRRVIFCNQAAASVLGRPAAEMVGQPFGAWLPPEDRILALVDEVVSGGRECHDASVTVSGPDGHLRELAVSAYRIQDDTRTGVVLSLRDLDPVRAVHSLVTYSQKLAALGRLTSGIAHEVKNPLNAMRIHLEVLRARMTGASPEARENLEVIAHEIQRLDHVVRGFLKFMRPQDFRPGPLDVNVLLSEVVALAAPEAEQSRVKTALDLAPILPPVAGDVELLRQACVNLLTNAVQAMPDGGTVTLSTRRLPGGDVEISVADEGVGIAPENLDKIFRLYYTTKPEGSGIGLSLVYRIVQMHDGRIDVDSTPGQGTTVRITLASAQAAAVA